MAVQQMNITLSPEMARYIRAKVSRGEYTNSSEVVRDALRQMQRAESSRVQAEWLGDFEQRLPKSDQGRIARRIAEGLKDIRNGDFVEYDAQGLRHVALEIAAAKGTERQRKQSSPATRPIRSKKGKGPRTKT